MKRIANNQKITNYKQLKTINIDSTLNHITNKHTTITHKIFIMQLQLTAKTKRLIIIINLTINISTSLN